MIVLGINLNSKPNMYKVTLLVQLAQRKECSDTDNDAQIYSDFCMRIANTVK